MPLLVYGRRLPLDSRRPWTAALSGVIGSCPVGNLLPSGDTSAVRMPGQRIHLPSGDHAGSQVPSRYLCSPLDALAPRVPAFVAGGSKWNFRIVKCGFGDERRLANMKRLNSFVTDCPRARLRELSGSQRSVYSVTYPIKLAKPEFSAPISSSPSVQNSGPR